LTCALSLVVGRGVTSARWTRGGVAVISSDLQVALPSPSCIFVECTVEDFQSIVIVSCSVGSLWFDGVILVDSSRPVSGKDLNPFPLCLPVIEE
jgi:hypothetical protein